MRWPHAIFPLNLDLCPEIVGRRFSEVEGCFFFKKKENLRKEQNKRDNNCIQLHVNRKKCKGKRDCKPWSRDWGSTEKVYVWGGHTFLHLPTPVEGGHPPVLVQAPQIEVFQLVGGDPAKASTLRTGTFGGKMPLPHRGKFPTILFTEHRIIRLGGTLEVF